jgi:hypothetical protein
MGDGKVNWCGDVHTYGGTNGHLKAPTASSTASP